MSHIIETAAINVSILHRLVVVLMLSERDRCNRYMKNVVHLYLCSNKENILEN